MGDPAQIAERAKLRRWRAVFLFVVSIAALWFLLLRGCIAVCDIKPHPVWTAASGKPVETRFFRMLGFPASASVALRDGQGNAAGTLDRAVGLTIEEEAAEWAGVAASVPLAVKRADLTLDPPGNWKQLLDRYNKAREARSKEFLYATLETERFTDGSVRVRFAEHGDDWITESTYLVIGGRAQPQELSLVGAGGGFEGLAKAVVAAPIFGFIGVVVTWLLRKVLLRREAGLPPGAERGEP